MINEKNSRTIKTGFYSAHVREMLDSVIGQLSDGMWENSPAMNGYWLFSKVDAEPDGEVVIKVSLDSGRQYCGKYARNRLVGMSDQEIVEWFANKIKQIAHAELKDNQLRTGWGWRRDNAEFETSYLAYDETITMSDVYLAYELMLHRHVDKKYPAEQIAKIVGKARTADEAEAEKKRRAEHEKIGEAYLAAYDKLDEAETAEKEAVKAKYEELREKLRAEYSAMHEAVDKGPDVSGSAA